MKCNFISIKLKDKNNIGLNNNINLELIKLSIGNNMFYLNYDKNKKENSKKNLKIIYYKKYIKSNIGNMLYKNIENNTKIQILNYLKLK